LPASVSRVPLTPFTGLVDNLGKSFTGCNLALHGLGVVSTVGIVERGLDYRVQHYFNRHATLSSAFFPIAITGALGPILLSGGVYLFGRGDPKSETYGAGCALIQANVVSFLYVSTLKAITGRPYPDDYRNRDMDSLSRVFRFGFMRGGIFWGWPSGHANATMTTVSCLTHYYPDNRWLKIGGYAVVAYTLLGVSAVKQGNMHWFSDGVAGALMGYAVGSSVGRAFHNRVQGKQAKENATRFRLTPYIYEEYSGLQVAYRF